MWTPQTWRDYMIKQHISYPCEEEVIKAESTLRRKPALVSLAEIIELENELAEAGQGKRFLLQGGDCAEIFNDITEDNIKSTVSIMSQMAAIFALSLGRPIIKIGRIAGQYAKPRSSLTETIDNQVLPSYFGDMINDWSPTLEARTPDPSRLVSAYNHSATTANTLRILNKSIEESDWRQSLSTFLSQFPHRNPEDNRLSYWLDMALHGSHQNLIASSPQTGTALYLSHEALSLRYEEALARQDKKTGLWFASSAHMLWVGERTHGIDDAHIEFVRGIANPIGIKCGPSITSDELLQLIERINPENKKGRLLLIIRMGADHISHKLPNLIRLVAQEGLNVIWISDPMHGNTITTSNGFKTREFEKVLREILTFFEIHQSEGSIPGGLHLEITGNDVTECIGGSQDISCENLVEKYLSRCDPRLNSYQSLELSLLIGRERINKKFSAIPVSNSPLKEVSNG
jgi:3-deoxy-7-phosphoheptulonate synthase